MKYSKTKIVIASLLLVVVSAASLLILNPAPAKAQVSGIGLSCSELTALIGALSSASSDPEFAPIAGPLVAVATAAKATYETKIAAKQEAIDLAIRIQLIGGIPDTTPPTGLAVPTDIITDSIKTQIHESQQKILASEVVKASSQTQAAAGDPLCTEAIGKVMDAMETAALEVIDSFNQLNRLETIISFLETMGGSLLGFGGGTPDIGKSTTTITDIISAKKQLVGVNLALRLYGLEMDVMEKAGTSSLISGTAMSARKAKLSVKISELEARQQKLKDLTKTTFTDYLKAFALSLGRQAILSATNTLISKMIKQFGIQSQYSQMQALAKNVYGIEYIRQNYKGDAEKAMITKYVMDSAYGYEPGKVKAAQTAIEQSAIRYAGPACTNPKIKDPNFAFNMAKCGNSNANPLFLKTEAYQRAQSGIAQAEASAANELAQNNGMNSIREYNRGSLEQQSTLDSENAQLLAAVELAQKKLTEAKKTNTANVIAQAQQELTAADKNYQDNFKKAPDGPVKLLFQGVTTPGAMVAKFVTDKGLSAMLSTDKLDENRLPAAIKGVSKLIGDMMTQWIGGGKANLGITLKDSVFSSIAPGISAITTAVNSNSNSGSGNGGSGPTPPGPNSRLLTITPNAAGLAVQVSIPSSINFAYWQLSIDGSPVIRQNTQRSFTYQANVDTTINHRIGMIVYEQNGNFITQDFQDYDGSTSTGGCPLGNCGGGGGNNALRGSTGSVAGAHTPLQIRGPKSVSVR